MHRLIRISPFDANARRQTAFASFDVVPALDEAEEPEIDPGDLRIDTYRSSGAGGQHVNVTDSAVRITHLPTGVVVSVQNERSQTQNKARAMQILAARLAERQRQERQPELDALSGEKRDVAFGSQIRTYTLQPYQLVKDERTRLRERQRAGGARRRDRRVHRVVPAVASRTVGTGRVQRRAQVKTPIPQSVPATLDLRLPTGCPHRARPMAGPTPP